MNQYTEQTTYQYIQQLVGSFDNPVIHKKSVEVAPGLELRFTVLHRTSIHALILMEAIEERVSVFACKVAVFKGFARGQTFEQFGVVLKKADMATPEGWGVYMEINDFLSDWLGECCNSVRIESLKAKATLKVA